MVLGLRSKTKKGYVHVTYMISIQEIKPWPPSESLKSLKPVVLQWENGEHNSGSTSPVSPSLGVGSAEGKIEFNESFMLQVSFARESSSKGNGLQKNVLELNLYEPRREKTKGQHLGTMLVDLAEHGILKDAVNVAAPLSSKRSFKNISLPVLYLRIQPFDRGGSSTSSKESLIDKDGKDSVSALMNEEYADEAEIASFTDDEEEEKSSRSSFANSSSTVDPNTDPEVVKGSKGTINAGLPLTQDDQEKTVDQRDKENGAKITTKEEHMSTIKDMAVLLDIDLQMASPKPVNGSDTKPEEVQKHPIDVERVIDYKDNLSAISDANVEQAAAVHPQSFMRNARRMSFAYDLTSSNRGFLDQRAYSTLNNKKAENMRFSIRSPSPTDSKGSIITEGATEQYKEVVKEVDSPEVVSSHGENTGVEDGKDPHKPIRLSTMKRNGAFTNKLRELELRVELLEGELREAAAIEAGLYSIIAEHGRSAHKVHTPARRISRLFLHALKHWSRERRASAARSASSGLVLVAKACGNDVPRLTFWLSNCVVLRTIIARMMNQSDTAGTNGPRGNKPARESSASKWESVHRKKGKLLITGEFAHWENTDTIVFALERIESWIFTRIVESIWWQIFTPQMQSAHKSNQPKSTKKSYGSQSIVGNQQQANLSIETWKKAFKDASERLCPVRAAGHECGCLPTLSRSVMEQCVARLDMAMFNAILREATDEMPTDPMSDPITDPKVLPVPSGKSSFGAGAQLKNAIGSWSRWLTDLFGIDLDDSSRSGNGNNHNHNLAESSKSFRLLNALSDLLMLPKDMLVERSVRKEVCPTFSSSIIKRILDGFVTDEFCPDPIPLVVLRALESEDHLEANEEGVRNVPCSASPIIYSPISISSVLSTIGDVESPQLRRSGSSVIRKSHTSDDELDELDSPLMSIVYTPTPTADSKKNTSHGVRYQLLREVWGRDE